MLFEPQLRMFKPKSSIVSSPTRACFVLCALCIVLVLPGHQGVHGVTNAYLSSPGAPRANNSCSGAAHGRAHVLVVMHHDCQWAACIRSLAPYMYPSTAHHSESVAAGSRGYSKLLARGYVSFKRYARAGQGSQASPRRPNDIATQPSNSLWLVNRLGLMANANFTVMARRSLLILQGIALLPF